MGSVCIGSPVQLETIDRLESKLYNRGIHTADVYELEGYIHGQHTKGPIKKEDLKDPSYRFFLSNLISNEITRVDIPLKNDPSLKITLEFRPKWGWVSYPWHNSENLKKKITRLTPPSHLFLLLQL